MFVFMPFSRISATNALRLVTCAAIAGLAWSSPALAQGGCPSEASINISSSGYSGVFTVELRRGTRPGSRVVGTRTMQAGQKVSFTNVCPGTLFFSFGTTYSEEVSVTRYFEVTNDGRSYSNPEISVFYSRDTTAGTQPVGKARKNDL